MNALPVRSNSPTPLRRPILFPAIDLKEGRCVRLVRGDMAQATVFNDDPADQAAQFSAQGFDWLHVVDLDGAFAGESRNTDAIAAILKAVPGMRIQLGGGIRNRASVERWLAAGATRVIIGTAAVRDPAFVREVAGAFPGRIAVGIDARDGMVAVDGWAATSMLSAGELAQRFADAGVATIIYTDISRDGVLTGINWEQTLALAELSAVPVIASGGLASLDDVTAMLAHAHPRIEGAISGRALYDGRIDARAALALIAAWDGNGAASC